MWPVLEFKTTWPCVISIKARKKEGKGKPTSIQEPLEGRRPPLQLSWVQNALNEQLETVKVLPCHLRLFPLKPGVDANWQEDVSAADLALDPSTVWDRRSLMNLPSLTLSGHSCTEKPLNLQRARRVKFSCRKGDRPGRPGSFVKTRCSREKTCQGQEQRVRLQSYSAQAFGGFTQTCNLVV